MKKILTLLCLISISLILTGCKTYENNDLISTDLSDFFLDLSSNSYHLSTTIDDVQTNYKVDNNKILNIDANIIQEISNDDIMIYSKTIKGWVEEVLVEQLIELPFDVENFKFEDFTFKNNIYTLNQSKLEKYNVDNLSIEYDGFEHSAKFSFRRNFDGLDKLVVAKYFDLKTVNIEIPNSFDINEEPIYGYNLIEQFFNETLISSSNIVKVIKDGEVLHEITQIDNLLTYNNIEKDMAGDYFVEFSNSDDYIINWYYENNWLKFNSSLESYKYMFIYINLMLEKDAILNSIADGEYDIENNSYITNDNKYLVWSFSEDFTQINISMNLLINGKTEVYDVVIEQIGNVDDEQLINHPLYSELSDNTEIKNFIGSIENSTNYEMGMNINGESILFSVDGNKVKLTIDQEIVYMIYEEDCVKQYNFIDGEWIETILEYQEMMKYPLTGMIDLLLFYPSNNGEYNIRLDVETCLFINLIKDNGEYSSLEITTNVQNNITSIIFSNLNNVEVELPFVV